MKLLLESGANPYARMTGGWTAAHCAAEAGRSEILQMLTDYRTPINIQDDYGDSPRNIAEIYGQRECAEILKRWVASVKLAWFRFPPLVTLDQQENGFSGPPWGTV